MKQIENAIRSDDANKEDIITIFLALQHQNFVLTNTVFNLVKKWPTPIPAQSVGLNLDESIQQEK